MARENLLFPAAGPEDGEAFAFESVGEEKGLCHLGLGRRSRQIDGFRNAAVAVLLKHRLHPHVLLG